MAKDGGSGNSGSGSSGGGGNSGHGGGDDGDADGGDDDGGDDGGGDDGGGDDGGGRGDKGGGGGGGTVDRVRIDKGRGGGSGDWDNSGSTEARGAVSRGVALPLNRVIPVVRQAVPGKVLDVDLQQWSTGGWVYKFLVLSREGEIQRSLRRRAAEPDRQGKGTLMRILVVEDEKAIATDVAEALGGIGYVVEIATDGEDAWFRGSTEDYDAIILDLSLPKLDGLSVLQRLRAEGMQTPILVLTARSAWLQRVEGIDAGADDYLTKPFHMEELIARVGALLRRVGGHSTPVLARSATCTSTPAGSARSETAGRSTSRRSSSGFFATSPTTRAGWSRSSRSPNMSTSRTRSPTATRSRRWWRGSAARSAAR